MKSLKINSKDLKLQELTDTILNKLEQHNQNNTNKLIIKNFDKNHIRLSKIGKRVDYFVLTNKMIDVRTGFTNTVTVDNLFKYLNTNFRTLKLNISDNQF